ncbi:MAG: FAD-binding oxidoreductase, partial [Stenotrophomonas sp.]
MSSAFGAETVLEVRHWTDAYFSFSTTRDSGFRFENGQFVMIGLENEGARPVMRAYSIASANWEEQLHFFSIKVQEGALTSRLQHLKPGDKVLVGK